MTLQYLHRPASTKQIGNPAIFLLHGYGSNEEDLFSFAPELPEHYEIFSFRAPLTMVPYGYAWYSIYFDQDDGKFSDDEQARESAEIALSNIKHLIKEHQLDADRITLIGFSQGAILSLALGLNHPDRIWRVAAMSGYLNTALLNEDCTDRNYDGLRIFASSDKIPH